MPYQSRSWKQPMEWSIGAFGTQAAVILTHNGSRSYDGHTKPEARIYPFVKCSKMRSRVDSPRKWKWKFDVSFLNPFSDTKPCKDTSLKKKTKDQYPSLMNTKKS